MNEVLESKADVLFDEFARDYLPTDTGTEHLAAYPRFREEARLNWSSIDEASKRGQNLTDLVLGKLLPHLNSPHNRERGVWIHIAPTITRDLKKWFENTGWAKPEDWPQIAEEILRFARSAINSADDLEAACRDFHISRFSKGIQAAFLSPVLNALRPEAFLIINSKSLKTLRYLTRQRYSRKILAYPESNLALQKVLRSLESNIRRVAPAGSLSCDVLDAFCHWLVAVKKVTTKRRPTVNSSKDGPIDRQDPESAARVLSKLYEDDEIRRACLAVLAEAIDSVDKYGSSRWSVSLFRRRVRLTVGKILTLELGREAVLLGLAQDVIEIDMRDVLNEKAEISEGVLSTPATALYKIPAPLFIGVQEKITPAFHEFLRVAAGTARKTPHTHSYSPGVLECIERELDRSLPRPAHDKTVAESPGGMPPAIAVTTPKTVFKKVEYDLAGLLTYIDNGDVGLPEIQRPFVWSASKVRDLFDSMYRGFPVGYLLFWENSEIKGTKVIGLDGKPRKVPFLLIVDGQQRLTSLYAVLRGKPVIDSKYRPTKIEIAFRPRDGRFEVSDAAIMRDPEFISNISNLWTSGKASFSNVNAFLKALESKRSLTEEDREAIGHNLDRLFDLQKYPFTTLEISSVVDEEDVSDIFVRINSEGVQLRQADFILTLLSVFWDEGRASLEEFSRKSRTVPTPGAPPSPFNYLIEPSPSQLLRTELAVGFHRARLRSVYQVLRGKDVETGRFSPDRRDVQFAKLREAQSVVLDLNHWQGFLGSLVEAGFRSNPMISSAAALMYTYAFFLIGKRQCKVEEPLLQRFIGRWYFMAALTGRYTGSAETIMEADLNRIRQLDAPEPFLDTLEKIIGDILTNDFWMITLPNDLETSASRSPAWFAYLAAQNKLGAPVLFSDKRLSEIMDPSLRTIRKSAETHHLFPRGWLEKNGYTERTVINQVANFAHLEWPDNARIGSTPPKEYLPDLQKRFSAVVWERMCRDHALPEDWEHLDYSKFLNLRRKLMAQVIRRGFEALGRGLDESDLHLDILEGTAAEQATWTGIQALETTLRTLVRSKYRQRWAGSADTRFRKLLGEQAWSTIERNRDKYLAQYRTSPPNGDLEILDFCYLGQLAQLMTANAAWDLFRTPFRDRRELEDLIRTIVPVRNDAAHFRSVPQRELERCRLAIDDLTRLISQL